VTATPLRPPFHYYGGKSNLAERIVRLMPGHDHYLEPFAGSLSVLLAKPRSTAETVNDLDRSLMTFWRVLRDRPDDLLRACDLTPHGRAELEEAYEPAADDLEQARRVWVRLSQGRGGVLGRRTGWRFMPNTRGYGMSAPDLMDSYVDRILPAAERLRGVSLECRPALELIDRYGRNDDVLIYADPPYPQTTRDSDGNEYGQEMRTDDDHRALAEMLRAARAAVVLSGYPSDLYDLELFPDWHRIELDTQTSQGGAGNARVEVLWSNRPLGHLPTLFDMEGA